jgi:hypothetical protein
MAYLAFQDLGGAAAVRAVASAAAPVAESGSLTDLEWSVIACARLDRRGSLRAEGRIDRLLRAVTGRPNPRLADQRLEALRRMAVLAWRDGYTVAAHEVRSLLAAGFTARQYETMVNHISAARVLPPRTVGS